MQFISVIMIGKDDYLKAHKEMNELENQQKQEEAELQAKTVDRVIVANQESEKATQNGGGIFF